MVEVKAHTVEKRGRHQDLVPSLPQKPTPVLKHSHQQTDDVNLVLK